MDGVRNRLVASNFQPSTIPLKQNKGFTGANRDNRALLIKTVKHLRFLCCLLFKICSRLSKMWDWPLYGDALAVAVRCAISGGNLRPRATSWAAVACTFSSKATRKNSASGIADSPARLAAQRTAANSSCVKAHFRLRKACRFIPDGLGPFGPGKGVPTGSGAWGLGGVLFID